MDINKLNYVDKAEDVIKKLIYTDKWGNTGLSMTTSKIRNILSMVSELYTDTNRNIGDVLSEDLQARVQYLKMRIAYECGRERSVKDFVEKSKLLDYIRDIKNSKENMILYCNYMEALVAYHKYYGGRD